jgi:23S rRNA pseudouridine2605 synthase
MEEKKRRPRINKPDSDSPLKERADQDSPEHENQSENQPENTERKPWQDRSDRPNYQNRERGEGGYERKPWQDRSQGGDRPNYQNRERGEGGYERKPWQDRNQGGDRPNYQNRERGEGGYERKPWQDRSQGGDRPNYQNRERSEGGERKPWQDRNQGGGGGYERKPWQDRSQGGDRPNYQNRERGEGGERKPWQDRNQGGGGGYERKPWQDRGQGGDRPNYQNRERGEGGGYERKPFNKGGGGFGKKPFGQKKPFRKKDDFYVEPKPKPGLPSGEGMPLNKYLAHCGVASRRKAVEFVENRQVTVNGEIKTEPYYRIQPGDVVVCNGKLTKVQERQVYILLNKPKNVITTTEDERGRTTVLDIVDPHFPERIYPVGRLDRDTTGLLLLTNDGDLAQKLSHPSSHVQKQYRVGLRKPLTQADLEHIERGVELEDGLMEVNWVRFSEDHPERDIVELEISSGRNRVVRRLFEQLGYEIFKLDRFYFAGLTKKDLQRGSFRELTQREIIMLKHFTGHPTGKRQRAEDMPDDMDGDQALDYDHDDEAPEIV